MCIKWYIQISVVLMASAPFILGACGQATESPADPQSGKSAQAPESIDQPGRITVKHPRSWIASEKAEPVEKMLRSSSNDRSLLIRLQPREDVDLVAYDLKELKELGYTITRTKLEPRSAMGQLTGVGTDYDLEKDGVQYRMYHLVTQFDFKHDVLIRSLTTKSQWHKSKRSMMFMIDSIAVGDLYQTKPDIAKPMVIGREVYSFEAPSNWHLNESKREPFTNLELSAKQFSWFTTTIIDRDLTAQAELDMYLNHSIDDQLVSHTKMTTWMGLTGVGVQGQLRESLAGYQQFKAFYAPLADGRLLVVNMYQAESSADLTDPGFELIESTFKLLVDPAP